MCSTDAQDRILAMGTGQWVTHTAEMLLLPRAGAPGEGRKPAQRERGSAGPYACGWRAVVTPPCSCHRGQDCE